MRILVLHEKHGDAIYAANSPEQLHRTAVAVVRDRLRDYYDNWDDGDPAHQWEDRARALLELQPNLAGEAAWTLLREREDHEYEGLELESVRAL